MTGGTGRVGVRVPADAIARAICRAARSSDHRDERESQRTAGDRRSRRGRAHARARTSICCSTRDRRLAARRRRSSTSPARRRGWCAPARFRGTRFRHGSTSSAPRVSADGRARASARRSSGLIAGRARRLDAERSLDELAGLAEAAGAEVVLRVLQERPKPDPSTFLGAGKIATLAASCAETGVDVVIFDNELTPAQLRHIEEAGRPEDHRSHAAHSRHLRAARADARRQAAGRARAAEVPAAAARRAPARRCRGWAAASARGAPAKRSSKPTAAGSGRASTPCREDIEQVRQRRAQLRERRQKASVPTVALVGYTNAGKTTLFNVLTRADAEASDALFVTLDPLVRQVRLPDSRELLVSDTVGFIDRLPHALVAAFRATLEEVAEADLILHVIDAAAPRSRPADGGRAAGARGGRRDRRAAHRGLQQVRPADAGRAAPAAGAGPGRALHLGAAAARASTSWSRRSRRGWRSTSAA